jgi:subtilisin family serine protease
MSVAHGEEPKRAVKIAVIDSGVAVPHPHIGAVAGGVSIDENGESPDYRDRIGHGTAVMAAIMEKAPPAEGFDYFAVRVFQSALRTRIDFVLRAIEWSIEQRMDLINLSLGTSNPAHAERFAPLIARATDAGALLISAAHTLPGSLAGVIAVGLDADCTRDQYRTISPQPATSDKALEFGTSGYPRPIPGVPPERNLNGISFAVANMTGFVAQVYASLSDRSYESVCAALEIGSSSNPRS